MAFGSPITNRFSEHHSDYGAWTPKVKPLSPVVDAGEQPIGEPRPVSLLPYRQPAAQVGKGRGNPSVGSIETGAGR
jgi:hypothetical protein